MRSLSFRLDRYTLFKSVSAHRGSVSSGEEPSRVLLASGYEWIGGPASSRCGPHSDLSLSIIPAPWLVNGVRTKAQGVVLQCRSNRISRLCWGQLSEVGSPASRLLDPG